jgi:hypothetical protein
MRARLRYLTCKLHLRLQPSTQQKKTTAFEILRAIKVRARYTAGTVQGEGKRHGLNIYGFPSSHQITSTSRPPGLSVCVCLLPLPPSHHPTHDGMPPFPHLPTLALKHWPVQRAYCPCLCDYPLLHSLARPPHPLPLTTHTPLNPTGINPKQFRGLWGRCLAQLVADPVLR